MSCIIAQRQIIRTLLQSTCPHNLHTLQSSFADIIDVPPAHLLSALLPHVSATQLPGSSEVTGAKTQGRALVRAGRSLHKRQQRRAEWSACARLPHSAQQDAGEQPTRSGPSSPLQLHHPAARAGAPSPVDLQCIYFSGAWSGNKAACGLRRPCAARRRAQAPGCQHPRGRACLAGRVQVAKSNGAPSLGYGLVVCAMLARASLWADQVCSSGDIQHSLTSLVLVLSPVCVCLQRTRRHPRAAAVPRRCLTRALRCPTVRACSCLQHKLHVDSSVVHACLLHR